MLLHENHSPSMLPAAIARVPLVATLAVLAVFAASCATSSGSAYDGSVAGERSAVEMAAAAKAEREKDDEQPSPWNPDPGDPYNPYYPAPPPASGSISLNFTVRVPTGTVLVRGTPPGAELYVDDRFLALAGPSGSAILQVETGVRTVRAEAFGYGALELTVTVPENGQVELDLPLGPVALTLEASGMSAAGFDPGRPGWLGRARAWFSATAPGRAAAIVSDGQGAIVADLGTMDISDSLVTVEWDGRLADGRLAVPGTYLITLRADTGAEAAQTVTVADLPPLRPASLYTALSGALLAPDASVMPEGVFLQTGSGVTAFIDADAGAMRARVPAWFGERMSLGERLEFAFSLKYVAYPGYGGTPSMDHASISGGMKFVALEEPGFAVAALLRGSYSSYVDEAVSGWPSPWDGGADYRGGGVGLVAEIEAGGSRAFASAELAASDFYPGWDDGRWAVPGFFAWVYLRAGVAGGLSLGRAGALQLAASAAARTEPIGADPGIRLPLAVAGELSWLFPDLPLSLNLYAAGELRAVQSWYFAGGLGFSLFL